MREVVWIYCDAQRKREMDLVKPGNEWNKSQTRHFGQTLAEKVEGRWRCRCCGKSVSVVW